MPIISPLSQVLANSVRMISSVLRIITGSEPRKLIEVAVYNAPSARDKKHEKDDVALN